jgi:LPXTG-site transpeptidase (sortase) family protein
MIVTAVFGFMLLQQPTASEEHYLEAQAFILDSLIEEINNRETEMGQPDIRNLSAISMPSEFILGDEGEALDAHYEILQQTVAQERVALQFSGEIREHIPDNAFPRNVIGLGILTIEKINMKIPILEGVAEDSLRIAPGRVPETAQIGAVGNAVIAGHRNYNYGEMFNRLGELVVGNVVGYHAKDGEYMEFVVFEIAVIEPEDQIAFIQPVKDSIITLYTCTPIGSSDLRLILRAIRVL